MRATRAQFSRVLVATDFSDGARAARARAVELPLAHDATLALVHITASNVPERWRSQVDSEARRSLDEEAAAVSGQLRANGRDDVAVTALAAAGQPFVEIIRRSRTLGAELVVVGRHGRRPFRDLFIGSTAMRVVRMGEAPVLIVRGRPAGPYRAPVLATDREDASLRLVDLVVRATTPGVKVTLVSAYDVPFRGFIPPGTEEHPTEIHRQYRDEAVRQLASFIAHAHDRGVDWTPVLRWGDARPVIVEVAKERNADLVVIGTQAGSPVAHALLGSVAEFVLEDAPCDVLVARVARLSFELP